ncbi:hypothetical protein KPATCC21470_5108 [Kitasatospora purpeofusca]
MTGPGQSNGARRTLGGRCAGARVKFVPIACKRGTGPAGPSGAVATMIEAPSVPTGGRIGPMDPMGRIDLCGL